MKTDYRKYRFSKKEILIYSLEAAVLFIVTDYLFYKSFAALILLVFFIPVYFRAAKKECIRKRMSQLDSDFKEALNALSVSVRAGHSMENAFIETERYLESTVGKDKDLTREIRYINSHTKLSIPVESLLNDLAARSGSENIENFAAVFAVAKRSGGNMAGIIETTARHIDGATEVKKEVETTIAGKKFEQKIMSVMPFFIILYMQLSFPELLEPLYSGVAGRSVMTVCLAVYLVSFQLGRKIVNIEV